MSIVTVEPGQIWKDRDYRMHGRHLFVLRIEGERAICASCTPNGKVLTQSLTRIRLDRFKPTSTGYDLVREAS